MKQPRNCDREKRIKKIAREQVGLACIGRNRVHESKKERALQRAILREVLEEQG